MNDTNPPADENSDEVGRRAKELCDTLNGYVYTDGLGEPEAVRHCRAFLHWILERRKKNTRATPPAAPADPLTRLGKIERELDELIGLGIFGGHSPSGCKICRAHRVHDSLLVLYRMLEENTEGKCGVSK
jgi:hypothetical protein